MLARLSSIPHAISESISKVFNCRRKSKEKDRVDKMSVHKPFKLQSVPSLVFEQVLHQMDPIEVFELSNCSKKTRILIQRARLASHCHLEWIDWPGLPSEISITMKSGHKFRWSFGKDANSYFHYQRNHLDYLYEKVGSGIIGGEVELRIYKYGDAETIYSIVNPCADVSDYLFDGILSIFPCLIKTLTIIFADDDSRFKNLFKNKSMRKCENLNVHCSKPDDFESLLRDFEVKKRVTISYRYLNPQFRETEIELANLVNLSDLCLKRVNLKREQLFTLNNEHLELDTDSITRLDVKEFLMRWMDGENKRLKTLRCVFSECRPNDLELFLDGLKLEQYDPSPCLVKFSDNFYIDCTTSMEPGHRRAMCIRNREGQNGTIVLTEGTLYFVVWTHPVPPVEVPNGHILERVPTYPLVFITPSSPQIF